jgi:hypothetical protein
MKTRLLIAFLGAVTAAFALGGGQAAAGPDSTNGTTGVTSPLILALIGNDDLFSTVDLAPVLNPTGMNHTEHYGAYPSGSTDSGTCGDWAQDTFDRHFTVRSNNDGTYTVVQQFKNGSFITDGGLSPGSCDSTDGSPPGTVDSGIEGSMHGYFIISVVGNQTSHDPHCNADAMSNDPCNTEIFIESHFDCDYPVTCTVGTYFNHYAAGDQGLVEHEWKNASDDRGGNHGDIRSTNLP